MPKPKNSSLPWSPADYESQHVRALQALAKGTCEEHQQIEILDWIINHACDTYGMSFRPDELGGARGTDFAEGKRFVGQQIVKMLKLNAATLSKQNRGKPTEQG